MSLHGKLRLNSVTILVGVVLIISAIWITDPLTISAQVLSSCHNDSDPDGLAGAGVLFVDENNCNCVSDVTGDWRTSASDPLAPLCHVWQLSASKGAQLQVGDTVYIRSGDYSNAPNESILFNENGTQDHPITISAYPEDTVILRDGGYMYDWFFRITGDYYNLINLNFEGYIDTYGGALGRPLLVYVAPPHSNSINGFSMSNVTTAFYARTDDIGLPKVLPNPDAPNTPLITPEARGVTISNVANVSIDGFTADCDASYSGVAHGLVLIDVTDYNVMNYTDACDSDTDLDGITNISDNCIFDSNPNQSDMDADGVGDTCDSDVCGDGVISIMEQCDDGNFDLFDGCDVICQIESGYTCDGGSPTICTDIDECVLGTHDCDSNATCTNTPSGGFTCTCNSGYTSDGVICQLVDSQCGNGDVESNEECDDGDLQNGDGCSNACIIENGYECIGEPSICSIVSVSSSSSSISNCGNGTVDDEEECDDGNTSNTDECLNDCMEATCGDGYIEIDIEICDDGNNSNQDACLRTCELATCGDGHVYLGAEECDDGNTSSGDGCSSLCVHEVTSVTYNPPPVDPRNICGNGIVESAAGEQCDDGSSNGFGTCSLNCRSLFCGDNLISLHLQEQCDDGNIIGGDGCDPDCWVEIPSSSMSTSSHASGVPEEEDAAPSVHDSAEVLPGECGDGHINEGEECDNGSDNSDVIPNTCRTSCRRPRCGDAVIDAGEQCDSGLNNSDLSPDRCRKTCILPYCGDGIVDTGEECDGDASCSNYCRRTVRESFCGNNLIETGEHCDDGNTFNGDGCSSLCRMEQAKAEETHAAAPNLVDVDTPALNTANPTSKDSLEPEQVEDSKKSVVAGTTFVSDVTASVIPTSARGAPVGDTGPAAMSVMIAGAAAGIGWIRRRKK